MGRDFFKTIIIGAGPAGVACALSLLKLGEDFLIIEKQKFPRNKPCAGYLTHKTCKIYEKLGLDIKNAKYEKIRGLSLYYKGKKHLKLENQGLYMNEKITRADLDFAFFSKIPKENILENTNISEVYEDYLVAGGRKIHFENIVFCDGTYGYSEKIQKQSKKINFALQCNIKKEKTSEIAVYFGEVKNGYAWESSSGESVNIGLCDVYKKGVNYRDILEKFAQSLGYNLEDGEVIGAFVPMKIKKKAAIGKRYFCGDALGIANPLTLAGVSASMQTGIWCGEAIINNTPKKYIKKINIQKRKMLLVRAFMKVFYLKITLIALFGIGTKYFGKIIAWALDNIILRGKYAEK